MTFNWFLVFATAGSGLIAGGVGRSLLSARSNAGRSIGVASLILIGGLVALLGAIQLTTEPTVFSYAHVLYMVLTVSVPLASLLVLTRWAELGLTLRLLLVLGMLGAPVGLYASHIEPFRLRIDRVDLASDRGAGLRVAVFSDLQTIEIGDYENRAIDAVIAQNPDIVLISGDFVQMPGVLFDERLDQFRGAMAKLSDGVPLVVAVNGNTDTPAALRRMTKGTDVVVLDNELFETDVNGYTVRIAGISTHQNDAQIAPMLDEFLTPGTAEPVRIVLGHLPDEVFRFDADDDYELLVAGHTHGGQIALPGIGPFVTLSDVPREIGAGGLHEFEGHMIYVSTGVGRERGRAPQVRFGVRPSIGIIDVVASDE